MLERHRRAADRVSPEGRASALRRFGMEFWIPSALSLGRLLESRGYCQADLALHLLREGYLADVEVLIGHPIQRCPPDPRLERWRLDPLRWLPHRRSVDERRVVRRVAPNPRLPTTDAFQRFRVIRPGMTVAQLLVRGVTRRDIRQAARKKWIEIEEVSDAAA